MRTCSSSSVRTVLAPNCAATQPCCLPMCRMASNQRMKRHTNTRLPSPNDCKKPSVGQQPTALQLTLHTDRVIESGYNNQPQVLSSPADAIPFHAQPASRPCFPSLSWC
ncbi:hypothetical protein BJX96DRAFT_146632 [Aspergillus floccosus]